MEGSLSLRRYLLSRLLWLILPIVLGVMALHWWIESSMLRELFAESLEEKATTLATLVTQHHGRLEFEFADEYMPQYSREEDPYYFELWLPDGTVMERSRTLVQDDLPYVYGTLEEPRSFSTTLSTGEELRCLGLEFPVRLGTDPRQNPATSVVVVVATSSALLDALLAQGLVKVVSTGALSVAGIALVVLLALRRGAELLERAADRVRRIQPSSPGRVIEHSEVPSEIRPLVVALNDSLLAIRGFIEREHRFNADVAHELRTPIAELRAAADVSLLWPDAESAKKLALDARTIAIQMGGVVESLLELSRLESDGNGAAPERFDLAQRVRLQVDQASRREADARTLCLSAPDSLELCSHPELWDVCLRNLLANALCYSPADARIEVHLEADGDGACLRVSNPAEELEEGTLARCTERLWRGRDSIAQGNHFGLGLSLVEAACARLAHRLELDFRERVFHATLRSERPA